MVEDNYREALVPLWDFSLSSAPPLSPSVSTASSVDTQTRGLYHTRVSNARGRFPTRAALEDAIAKFQAEIDEAAGLGLDASQAQEGMREILPLRLLLQTAEEMAEMIEALQAEKENVIRSSLDMEKARKIHSEIENLQDQIDREEQYLRAKQKKKMVGVTKDSMNSDAAILSILSPRNADNDAENDREDLAPQSASSGSAASSISSASSTDTQTRDLYSKRVADARRRFPTRAALDDAIVELQAEIDATAGLGSNIDQKTLERVKKAEDELRMMLPLRMVLQTAEEMAEMIEALQVMKVEVIRRTLDMEKARKIQSEIDELQNQIKKEEQYQKPFFVEMTSEEYLSPVSPERMRVDEARRRFPTRAALEDAISKFQAEIDAADGLGSNADQKMVDRAKRAEDEVRKIHPLRLVLPTVEEMAEMIEALQGAKENVIRSSLDMEKAERIQSEIDELQDQIEREKRYLMATAFVKKKKTMRILEDRKIMDGNDEDPPLDGAGGANEGDNNSHLIAGKDEQPGLEHSRYDGCGFTRYDGCGFKNFFWWNSIPW